MILLAEEVSGWWKWPNFLMLVWLLGYLIKKHGTPLLTARSEQIRQSLEAGEKAKKEAEARAAAVEAKIKNLDREIAEFRTSSKADLEREADRIRRQTESELSSIEQHTAAEIVTIGKNVRSELRREAAKLAVELAEQKVRARMSPDTQSTLVTNFTGDLSRQVPGSDTSGAATHV